MVHDHPVKWPDKLRVARIWRQVALKAWHQLLRTPEVGALTFSVSPHIDASNTQFCDPASPHRSRGTGQDEPSIRPHADHNFEFLPHPSVSTSAPDLTSAFHRN